jgi:hypothetical protein
MFAFRPAFLLPVLFLLTAVNALHFYLDANEKRCFIEELPSDTVVEGTCQQLLVTRPWSLNACIQDITRHWNSRTRRKTTCLNQASVLLWK